MPITASLLTATAPGAIAVIGLTGEVGPLLDRLAAEAGRSIEWTAGRCRLLDIALIDEALVVRLDDARALVMPHGGPLIVRRLLEHLAQRGATVRDARLLDAPTLYPEAADLAEAQMLAALARAESPLAMELLLDQPRRWREQAISAESLLADPETIARSARLDRLIDPPLVALVGPPNVGKSSLTNLLAGREVAIVADRPGTTRDSVGCRLLLAGLVVDWHDTPGVRETSDPLEREATALARGLIERCDCLVAVTDASHEWPALTRRADLLVCSRSDLGRRRDVALHVSAVSGEGVADLVVAIRNALVPEADLRHEGVWILGRKDCA